MVKPNLWLLLVIVLASVFLSYEFASNAVGYIQLISAIAFIIAAVGLNVSFIAKAKWAWIAVLLCFLLFIVNFFTIDNDITGKFVKFFGALFDAALHFK
ncbi:MAG: hypothetical protein AMJ53_03830 [Gammaproteobacteria bacterium SG8_11]|nr:MAG: hypothetical protein AMJ53_03830 [Gammaproteobacteria bacterium SG8_11]